MLLDCCCHIDCLLQDEADDDLSKPLLADCDDAASTQLLLSPADKFSSNEDTVTIALPMLASASSAASVHAIHSSVVEVGFPTVVLVVSEFGRTMRENGTRGTDHGHGTVYWALGGGLGNAGGKVVGDQQSVNQSTLFQNRDYQILNEYREVLAGIFSRMYGLSAADLDRVFSGTQARDLGVI